MERKPNLTRQELYDRVWAHPVSKIAKVYGLSDRGLAKLCDRNSVPTPPRGYPFARHEPATSSTDRT